MSGKFELRKSINGQYHFRLKASNGESLLSSEMYNSKSEAENGIESVKKNARLEGRYEHKISASWQPYFVLKAANGEPIGTSQIYPSAVARDKGIESVKLNAPNATLLDLA
jgi:uncharacterized protein YegP (UPF0339 family)